jgi:hypothetical protein
VLISDKVNIWREVLREEAGFSDSDTTDGTVRMLQRWLELAPASAERMRDRAGHCFLEHFEIGRAARRLVTMVRRLSAKSNDGVDESLA